LFAGALHVNLEGLWRNKGTIATLSTVGVEQHGVQNVIDHAPEGIHVLARPRTHREATARISDEPAGRFHQRPDSDSYLERPSRRHLRRPGPVAATVSGKGSPPRRHVSRRRVLYPRPGSYYSATARLLSSGSACDPRLRSRVSQAHWHRGQACLAEARSAKGGRFWPERASGEPLNELSVEQRKRQSVGDNARSALLFDRCGIDDDVLTAGSRTGWRSASPAESGIAVSGATRRGGPSVARSCRAR
jgi:hypothetical protein